MSNREIITLLDAQFGSYVPPTPPSELFHYTDSRGLIGIVGSDPSFWATDVRYLNDAHETIDIDRIVSACIQEKLSQNINDAQRAFLSRALFTFKEMANRYFVFCMCERENLLSQWRAYGGHGDAYSLGIKTEEILQDGRVRSNVEVKFLKCIYVDDEKRKIVNDRLDFILGYIKRSVTDGETEKAKALIPECCQGFRKSLNLYDIMFKHNSFSEEQEWRMIVTEHPFSPSPPIEFRAGNYGLTPYIKVRLSCKFGLMRDKPPVSSIWVGPSRFPELSMQSVVEFTKRNGYKQFEILQSIRSCGLPFRVG